jgi:hypothetical protein
MITLTLQLIHLFAERKGSKPCNWHEGTDTRLYEDSDKENILRIKSEIVASVRAANAIIVMLKTKI